jgi:predicted tellurium resistance membrane protein TerC
VFSLFEKDFSGRDLILIAGGIFLLIKSIGEIHHKVGGEVEETELKKKLSFTSIIFQIMLLDLVFSFDSILTAIGMIDQISIMIAAVVISLIVMIIFSGQVSAFINQNPTIQILALSFLILIGFVLIVDGLDVHVPKGYVYFALFFSLIVEMLNLRLRNKSIKK